MVLVPDRSLLLHPPKPPAGYWLRSRKAAVQCVAPPPLRSHGDPALLGVAELGHAIRRLRTHKVLE